MICFAYILYANYIPVGNIVIKNLAMYRWFVIRFLEICEKNKIKRIKKKHSACLNSGGFILQY
jgi:hypothetical protein